jgi:hypothetical protein
VAHVGQELGLGPARHLGHFLGHAQPDLALAQLGDVGGGAAIACEGAGGEVEHRHRAQQEGLHLAGLGDHVDRLVAERRMALEAQLDGAAVGLAAAQPEQVAPDQLARMIAEHLRHPARHLDQGELGIGLPGPVGDQAHQVVDAVAQRGDRLQPLRFLRQHLDDAGDGDDLSVLAAQRRVARAQTLGAVAEGQYVLAEHHAAEQGDLRRDLLGRQQRTGGHLAQPAIAGIGPDQAAVGIGDIEGRAMIEQRLAEDLGQQRRRQGALARQAESGRVRDRRGSVDRRSVRLRSHRPWPPPPS